MDTPGVPIAFKVSTHVPQTPIPTSKPLVSTSRGKESPRRSPTTPPPVEAEIGLTFRWGGYDCLVNDVNKFGAVVAIGSGQLTVEFGARVVILGSHRTLAVGHSSAASGPRKGGQTSLNLVNPPLREALKKWRREQASTESVPAFIIFYDTTLDELCEQRPQTLSELRRVNGFGPVKVEKYGDSILAIVSEHLN